MNRLARTWVATGAVAVAAMTATVAVAEQRDNPAANAQPGLAAEAAADPAYAAAPATRVNPALAQHFAVLRAAANPPSPATRQSLDPNGLLQQKYGVNFALARSVPSQVDGDVWVLPGNGSVCLAVKDPVDGWGETCQPEANLSKGFLRLSLGQSPGFPAGKSLMAGVLPDDASGITVTERNGTRRSTPTRVNLFASLVTDPSSVTVQSTDGGSSELSAYSAG